MANIVPYHGEFLINPIPLEMSMGTCNHGCQYCFATAKPQGENDTRKQVESTIRWLATYQDKHSFEAQLMQQGYPVVVSNRADPFARSGETAILPVAEIMRDMKIPMMIQTKGGRKLLDFAKTLPPSSFYISLAFDVENTKLCRQIEPGAPTPQERLDAVKALKAMGHVVYIGWNPCVEEWVVDPVKFAKDIKKSGADGVWLEALHMSRLRTTTLDSKAINNLGKELISSAMDKKNRPLRHFVDKARWLCKNEGLEVFSAFSGEASDFWKPTQRIYEKTFPIWQDCLNHLHKEKPTDLLNADWFAQGFVNKFPKLTEKAECGHILTSQRWTLAHDPRYSNKMNLEQVMDFIMSDERAAMHPSYFPTIAFAADIDETTGENNGFIVDNKDRKMFLFVPEGTDFDCVATK